MKGTKIMVTPDPKGRFEWGVINDTSSPGTIMQLDSTVAFQNGRFGWKASAPGTDGIPVLMACLLEDELQGFSTGTAYTAGTLGQMYYPQRGEEMNLLTGEVAGTGNTFTIGGGLIIDAETGILVPTAGSPVEIFAFSLETISQQAGNYLLWCKIQ